MSDENCIKFLLIKGKVFEILKENIYKKRKFLVFLQRKKIIKKFFIDFIYFRNI